MQTGRKMVQRADLESLGERLRAEGRRVVFTNGCFDILHVGHVRYLQEARAPGDALVVGLNSDASVRALKGPTRPIVPAEERAELLAALECVDYVTVFGEPLPNAVISLLKPDIHVKGGDYRGEDLPEAEVVRAHGGEVRIMPLVPGRSTTDIVSRIVESVNRGDAENAETDSEAESPGGEMLKE
jgi:D-glycero-beta-D-manno-heptose 1-phosphate adenylyltransferase